MLRADNHDQSKAVLQPINDVLGQHMLAEVVKMASSFSIGMGKAQCLCRVVSGGEMALSIVYGHTKRGECCNVPLTFLW